MPRSLLLVLLLNAAMWGAAQTAPEQAAPPTDPQALIAAAAKYYDFSSADLKPWHLKATYQLYDMKGKATAEGTWEYWWASPKVHRSTWTRAGAERTDWQAADGILYRKESGEPLKHFERTIDGSLISPLPAREFTAGTSRLDLKMIPAGSGQLACAVTTWVVDGKPQDPGPGGSNYKCFDSSTLALRMIHSQSITTEFNRIVKTQGRYLAQNIEISIGNVKAFSFSVEKIDGISSTDVALTPAPDAVPVHEAITQPPPGASPDQVTTGSLAKKSPPVYPAIAKAARIQGTVVLAATIGKDGKVYDLEVLASPDKLLTESALDSVKRWEYKPYLLNGVPVEVETTINVFYALSR